MAFKKQQCKLGREELGRTLRLNEEVPGEQKFREPFELAAKRSGRQMSDAH